MRVIFHIDMNAFFANCEISQYPEYAHKPMVIAHDSRRSVVSTASYEARKFGIHSAMPLYLAKQKCPQLLIVEPHFDLYRRLSHAFFKIVSSYSYIMEVASIDECYVNVSDYIIEHHIHPADLALEIQQRIMRELHLPCSIGIAPNKFLAKMASDMRKPMGITMLTRSNIKQLLWPLPVDAFFGIGKKTAPKLKAAGIETIGDVANYANYQTLRQILGRHALIYYNKANGRDDAKVIYQETDVKSIGNTTTFEEDISDEKLLEDRFKEIALNVSSRAQKSNMVSNNISITIRYDLANHITRQMNISSYTNDFERIFAYAMMLFREHYNHKPVRLIGITLNNVVRKDQLKIQMSMFDEPVKEEPRELKVDDIIKTFNKENDFHLMKASSLLKGEKTH